MKKLVGEPTNNNMDFFFDYAGNTLALCCLGCRQCAFSQETIGNLQFMSSEMAEILLERPGSAIKILTEEFIPNAKTIIK